MNITWNANRYGKQFSFVPQYGESVMELLDIRPGMTVLDLGCGTGVLTQRLAERGAEVIGMDASEYMLAKARETYPRLRFVQGNGQNFCLEHPVDAVFSNAVFHWIDDQDGLFHSIAGALKPGGQLVFEMGGKGCAETVHQALDAVFSEHGYHYDRPQYFPTIGEYAPILERHGLRVNYAWLFDRDTLVEGEDGVADWIRMFLPMPFEREAIPETEKQEIICEAAERTRPKLRKDDGWHVDYVRLRIKAVRL